jgi:hypothetical protein
MARPNHADKTQASGGGGTSSGITGRINCQFNYVSGHVDNKLLMQLTDSLEGAWQFSTVVNPTAMFTLWQMNLIKEDMHDHFGYAPERVNRALDRVTCDGTDYDAFKQHLADQAALEGKQLLSKANAIARDKKLSPRQRDQEFKILQNTYGEEMVTTVLR